MTQQEAETLLKRDVAHVALLRRIVEHVATNMERESVFLSSDPAVFMRDPYGLLQIIEDAGIPAETIDAWMVAAQDAKEGERP